MQRQPFLFRVLRAVCSKFSVLLVFVYSVFYTLQGGISKKDLRACQRSRGGVSDTFREL